MTVIMLQIWKQLVIKGASEERGIVLRSAFSFAVLLSSDWPTQHVDSKSKDTTNLFLLTNKPQSKAPQ